MRKQRPRIAHSHEVTIKRDGEYGVIEFKDPTIMSTHLKIGPDIASKTDEEILDLYNECIRAQSEHIRSHPYVAVEVPLGKPQINYEKQSDQWVPCGNVLRCLVEDGASEDDGWVTICVDDKELSLHEFGRMLSVYAGWGMRIEFIPEEDIHRRPRLEVREPVVEEE